MQKLTGEKPSSADGKGVNDACGGTDNDQEQTQSGTKQAASNNNNRGKPIAQHSGDKRTTSIGEHESGVHGGQGQRIHTGSDQRHLNVCIRPEHTWKHAKLTSAFGLSILKLTCESNAPWHS